MKDTIFYALLFIIAVLLIAIIILLIKLFKKTNNNNIEYIIYEQSNKEEKQSFKERFFNKYLHILTFLAMIVCGIVLYKVPFIKESEVAKEAPSSVENQNIYTPPLNIFDYADKNLTPLDFPVKGILEDCLYDEGVAPLKITTSEKANYFIMLKKLQTDEYITLFIPADNSYQIDVPLGKYELRYCCGDEWYGEKHLFGRKTTYYKAKDIFDFYITSDGYYGYEVELIKQINGNLQEIKISQEEFWD